MDTSRKYEFSWDLLGDLQLGRPNLGPSTRLEVYRLMLFCFRDVLEKNLGTVKTDHLFYEAGYLAGTQLYDHLIGTPDSLNDFVVRLQKVLLELGIGILRVEQADTEKGEFMFTISEDLDCSGLPESDTEVCVYDEGIIAALLESFTGKKFHVHEIDCWCSGDRTCRFKAVEEK
ncbi:MAG TPA: V4R domain-containing protein [Negativicutes bacterium]|nr:V4R domain-containing protein [Negativicutes bacterium]